ncbi:hypothetical protein N7541_004188 [Penicillium brevicompactum]|uniref:R3H domain-containing protein n=1 Tax=Penicillium brevicompactum TaxID=5074 RepID=A0A9W9RQC8_PENBR|nr:hypothetical protein N7541_004188 [Penicillium brevicompactum]
MTNFDSKSLASVTTFAMDEKDSVRPDDSASVQAIDEEESLSGHASGAPNSVAGSEAGSRAFRDAVPTRPRGMLPVPGPLFNGSQAMNGTIPPDSVANNFVMPANPDSVQDGQNLHGFPLEPDEKLLEAMKSPKDRLLILQLEEKIRYFIKNCNEQSLELPPSNAFGRLLAHKLGDYYHLTHFVDNNVTSQYHSASSYSSNEDHATKRRGQLDGSMGGSSNPSKANSEAGDSGPDGERNGSSSGATPAKDRAALTREEREAKYHQVRERIFRDFPDSAKSEPTSGESNHDISRASSTNGRKKNQKQRTPVDDSFEVRSQFEIWYPGVQYSNGPASYNTPVNDGSANQVPYLVGPGVPPPSGGYLPSGQTGAIHSGAVPVNGPPQYPAAMSPQMPPNSPWQGTGMPQQPPYPGYGPMNQPGMMNQPPSNASSPALSNYAVPNTVPYQQPPNWNSAPYQTHFQQSPQQRNGPPVHWPNYQHMPPNMQPSMGPNMGPSMPPHMGAGMGGYPYHQYPGQHMNTAFQNTSASHPMQPAYPRSHFNPQTRSFVPGGIPPGRHTSRPTQNSHSRRPTHGASPYAHGTSRLNRQMGNTVPPSPKPPPSEVPSDFDLKNRSVPASVPAHVPMYVGNGVSNGPLVVSGGVALPKQN